MINIKISRTQIRLSGIPIFCCPHAIYFKVVPEKTYEKNGFRGDVIFPGGMILEESGEVKIYYGAADTVECLAIAEIGELLDLVTGETV